MSNKIAKKTQAFFVKALLLLLILSFGLWGIGDYVTPALQGGSVATVENKEVSAQQVYQDIQRELQRMRQLTGQADVQESLGSLVANSVVEQAVNSTLLEVSAEDIDVAISDQLVRQSIRNNEIFQDGGSFSRARFDQIMFSNNLNEAQFIEIVRSDLAREHVVSVLLNGVNLPDQSVQALYRHLEERRIVDYVRINANDLVVSSQPDETALRAYYSENQNDFLAPEYRTLSLLHIKPSDVADSIEVPFEDIEDAYSARLNEFRVEETRNIIQMIFENEADARAAIDLVKSGQPFAEVAQQKLGMDEESITLGTLQRNALPEELQGPAFEVALNGVTDPVQSLLGWHVLSATEISEGKTQSFEEVRDQIRNDLALERAGEELFTLSNEVEDALGGGATIEEAAGVVGKDLLQIAFSDAQGLDQQGTPVSALENFPALLQEAFQASVESEPQMRDDSQGGYFLVRVDNITPSQPRPFETIQDQVAIALVASLKEEQAANLAKQLADQLAGNDNLAEIALQNGLITQVTEPFSRANSPFAEGLTTDVFGASEGAVLSGQNEGGYIVGVLKEVVPFTQTGNNAQLDNIRNQLNVSLANDLQAQFVTALRREYPVEINQSLLNSMLSQSGQNAR